MIEENDVQMIISLLLVLISCIIGLSNPNPREEVIIIVGLLVGMAIVFQLAPIFKWVDRLLKMLKRRWKF